MRLAIMQPYFFPYIGYFQLIYAVDTFVVYDDVNYINRGWINRNNLLAKDKPELVTLQLMGASQNKLINEIHVGHNRLKLLKNISQKYSKAPCFQRVFPVIEDIMCYQEDNLSLFLDYSLRAVCDYLSIHPKWMLSSYIEKDNALKGQNKILSICKSLHATHYINPPGGRHLYDHELFEEQGIKLSFIETECSPYKQFSGDFVSHCQRPK
ncbi:WbqC family protein [methane-oxidizing endosymbiont of Gigantopelta aegis]|uniref:WbqC family protein n=1 Tax=methane-oxidizing endosymbiont of Gigantopelta aegis TaxID=2794938 RepID=UPI001FD873CF|nr:WbqC family protein [methane-oxidizing endosymbiont of Gigantopelta aegis]